MDTGAFVALVHPTDPHHSRARDCLNEIASRSLPVFAATPTLHETHRRLLYDQNGEVAREWLARIRDGSVNLLRPGPDDEQEAMSLLERYEDLDLTFTDAVNMAVMRRRGLGMCFSFDAHFLQAGFLRVPPLP